MDRHLAAAALASMMELFKRFTIVNPVNDADGNVLLVTYWTNADAEQRYNELKERYQQYQKQKESEE